MIVSSSPPNGALQLAVLILAGLAPFAQAREEPLMEPVTLHSLGVHWILGDGEELKVEMQWRAAGAAEWRNAEGLIRVERGAHLDPEHGSPLKIGNGAALFAGSVVNLRPDTAYDLRLREMRCGAEVRVATLSAKTRSEPVAPANAKVKHVAPGEGGGSGTEADPFRGLAAAEATAQPGDLFLVRAGTYRGPFNVKRSGSPDAPIVWRGAGAGATILEGSPTSEEPGDRAILASDTRDVWFERFTIRHAQYGLVAHEAARLVVRRCHFHDIEFGIAATRNERHGLTGWFVSDNVMEGPSTWPRTKGIEEARAIQLSGTGHDVCYNRIRGFADAIDTFPSPQCAAIDIHHNDISEMTDDGIELDFAQRNVRCFENRLTDIYQGISLQPVFGGPVYVFRNVLYNVVVEPFKLHNSPSGVHLIHNTTVKSGTPFEIAGTPPVRHTRSRNNLFIGTVAPYAAEFSTPMHNCDFDFDGFGGGPWKLFLKWHTDRFETLAEVRSKAPAYHHAVLVQEPFASGARPPEEPEKVHAAPDLRLKAGSAAIDVAVPLPGFNDAFAGKGPDLGAYEIGTSLPHYGPRPESTSTESP